MIAFLKGILAAKTPTGVYIDVSGVGFEVGLSGNSLAQMPELGQPVQVFTYLQVRDDGMSLFGFCTLEEKSLFESLIGVSGVGPRIALAALSSYSTEALAAAISDGDVALIQRVPGIGKKMASRIVLELKGSLESEQSIFASGAGSGAPAANSAAKAAVEDLLAMGFTSAEADLALKDAPAEATEQALLKFALQKLGSA